jgi:c-di-GMP-binding flagellar brake protein YcgR
MPELARYLSILQKQIELLTDKLIPEQDQFSDDGQSVNISGQGISFYSHEIARAGDVLELNLKLAPSGLQLVAFARVVLVEDHNNADQGKYKLSLDFEHIHDADQEILIKHVHGKQLSALGASRSDET